MPQARADYTPLCVLGEMASDRCGVVLVPRLNFVVTKQDLRVAILGSVQCLGYDCPTENQKCAVGMFVRGNDVFVSLPTGSGKSVILAFQEYSID